MKKIIVSILVVILVIVSYFAFFPTGIFRSIPEGFAKLENGRITINDSDFHVIAINYKIILRKKPDGTYFPNRFLGYEPSNKFLFNDPSLCIDQIQKDFQLCKQMGFNTLRIVGIGEANIINQKKDPKIYYAAHITENNLAEIDFQDENDWKNFQNAIGIVLDAAAKSGLKVIFTTKLLPGIPVLDDMFESIVSYHKGRKEILAYDFLNEPLYFDSVEHSKKDAYFATLKWDNIVKNNSPHLSTIGLACQRELFVWDPNLMNVDFISFHPYEYESNQVVSEIYWYNKFVNKPWILGETGVPADGDSIPYIKQVDFAQKTLYQEINCNGNGYSWWQFKDVSWGGFHQSYLGLVNHKDSTLLPSGEYALGTVKDLGQVLPIMLQNYQKSSCVCPANYYNFSENNAFSIQGKVTDENGNPIEGAGILAWDEFYIDHYFTTSKPDGSFELYSDYKFHHWMVSALEHERKFMHFNPEIASNKGNTMVVDMGTVELKKIEVYPWMRWFQ